MPTDLPPDYKPSPARPGAAPGQDIPGGVPQPGPGVGVPGQGGDVVDPPGWREPPIEPGGNPIGVPTPAGTPTF